MKNFGKFILAGAALLALASCNKGLRIEALSGDGLREIAFTADQFDSQVSTRAVSVVTSLSSFYAIATTGTPGNSAEAAAFTSTSFTKSGSTYTGGKYWPSTDPSYHFYAASKALTLSSGNVTFKPSATIADDVYAYNAGEAYTDDTPPSSVALRFNHIYAQVGKCTISAPSGYTVSGLTVKITPKLPTANATFNVRTGAWSTTASHYSNGSEVTLCTATGSTTDNDLWLVPGSYTLTADYTLTKGAYSESFSKTSTVSLVMGCNNNIAATLPAGNASEIVFTVTVNPWSDNTVNATFN